MNDIINFLLTARTKTYAGSGGSVEPALSGSKQLEYSEGDYLYRDIYYVGERAFLGIETIYFQNKPVWNMVYRGEWNPADITNDEIREHLPSALIANAKTARTNQHVEWSQDNYRYLCEGEGELENFHGTETLFKNGKSAHVVVYYSAKL